MKRRTWTFAAASLLLASGALADADVEVRVLDSAGRPADAKITIQGPQTLSCNTVASRCTIKAPAGSYSLSVEPRRDRAPPPRTLDVPASGAARVVVSLLAPEAVNPSVRKVGSSIQMANALKATTFAPKSTAAALAVAPAPPAPTTPAATTPAATTPAAPDERAAPPGKNLAKGLRRAMSGSVLDKAGRPADAVLVLTDLKGNVVGHVKSVAGRFSLYDLPAGAYQGRVYPRRGGPPLSQRFVVTRGAGKLVVKVP